MFLIITSKRLKVNFFPILRVRQLAFVSNYSCAINYFIDRGCIFVCGGNVPTA